MSANGLRVFDISLKTPAAYRDSMKFLRQSGHLVDDDQYRRLVKW